MICNRQSVERIAPVRVRLRLELVEGHLLGQEPVVLFHVRLVHAPLLQLLLQRRRDLGQDQHVLVPRDRQPAEYVPVPILVGEDLDDKVQERTVDLPGDGAKLVEGVKERPELAVVLEVLGTRSS